MKATQARKLDNPAVKVVKSDRDDVSELARQVGEMMRSPNLFAKGTIHEFNATAVPVSVAFTHGLGRIPDGWILLELIAATSYMPYETSGTRTSSQLFLQFDTICKGKVLIY